MAASRAFFKQLDLFFGDLKFVTNGKDKIRIQLWEINFNSKENFPFSIFTP